MRQRLLKRILAAAAIAFLVVVALLWFAYRPWALNWGATQLEVTRAMPGDSIVGDANFVATRAVAIDAPPEAVWPWIIQMGYHRAGFYSWDRLDNDGIPSAEHVISEYQRLAAGDSLPLTAHDWVTVTTMEPDRSMVWEYAGDSTATVFTWVWELHPVGDGRTRLVTRLRYRASSLRSRMMLDFFEIIMMRKCMLGIKRRVEAYSTASSL